MSDLGKAVFISYASQDAEAAKRICESLRSAGVEVWFDQEGGLEHGDEWDAKIRRQIRECLLFLPVISANTQARHEGYFRLEWELAAERAMGIATGVAFILPVVIDDTGEAEALVPDRFRRVQWTRLPGGVLTPETLQRLVKLWSQRLGIAGNESARPAAATRSGFAAGRSLAAILFTDVVGYSARMQRDEKGTLSQVEADFRFMRERCQAHEGEVLNSMGDGLLMCFPSAVQAVACALEMQGEFVRRRTQSGDVGPLEHRMGVHIGDVIRAEGGVAGDGVNIAARLEGKAPPGGVCISQIVHDTVTGKVPMQSVFIGPESFKNITAPIPIWHIAPEGAPTLSRPPMAARAKGRRGPRRLALAAAAVAAVTLGLWLSLRKTGTVQAPVASRPQVPALPASTTVREPKFDWPPVPKAGTRYGRVLLAGFENRSGDPALQNLAVLLNDKLSAAFTELDWVEEVVRPTEQPARVVKSLAEARLAGLAAKADTVVGGTCYREGARLTLQATLFDVRVDKEFARLAPITGDASDSSAAVEELVQRVLGAADFIDDERRPERAADFRKMYNFSVPPRLDARRISGQAGRMPSVAEERSQMRRAFELDPRGSFLSLLSLANSHFEENEYEATQRVVDEIRKRPEFLTPYTRAYLDWLEAALKGSLAGQLSAARQAHSISPRIRTWQTRMIRTLYYLNRPTAVLRELDAIEALDRSAAGSEFLLGWRIRAHGLLDNFDEALKLVEQYRRKYPDKPFPLFQQVYLLGRLGRVEASVAVWTEGERLPGAGPRWGALLRRGSLSFLRDRVPPAELQKVGEEVLRWGDSRPERERSAATYSPLRQARVKALSLLGRHDEAKAELGRTPQAARTREFESWEIWWADWGVNAVHCGDAAEARATLRWLNERDPKYQFGRWHYARARIHAALGERTEALRALREAAADSYPLAGEAVTPEFHALRDDPEFKTLVEIKG